MNSVVPGGRSLADRAVQVEDQLVQGAVLASAINPLPRFGTFRNPARKGTPAVFFTRIDTEGRIPRTDEMEKNPRHDAKNNTLPNKAILK